MGKKNMSEQSAIPGYLIGKLLDLLELSNQNDTKLANDEITFPEYFKTRHDLNRRINGVFELSRIDVKEYNKIKLMIKKEFEKLQKQTGKTFKELNKKNNDKYKIEIRFKYNEEQLDFSYNMIIDWLRSEEQHKNLPLREHYEKRLENDRKIIQCFAVDL